MAYTPLQDRTRVEVMGGGRERPLFDRDLADRLSSELERRLEPASSGLREGEQLWVTKAKLTTLHARCEGLFMAEELEGKGFAYGPQLAAGKVVHKAVEIGVYSSGLSEAELAERAVGRLSEQDPQFADYIGLLDEVERSELLGESVRQLSWFAAAFPPLDKRWNPVVEWPVRVELCGGRIVLSARPDIVLGRDDDDEPMRARRLVLELKAGQERPEQDEDLRFYALVMALKFGVPPFRVVTVNLSSGSCRPQDVTEDALFSAVRRVADAAGRATALLGGEEPALRPGRWCSWCPRSMTCPVSTVRGSVGKQPEE
jgi:hypothetical protein